MEMFNVHRRDVMDFDNYMDLKKESFGGPKSAIAYRDAKGNKVNSDPKLKEFQRTVKRDALFSHPVYDPTYKAMTHDLVYKQDKKKPFSYNEPSLTGIPVVDITESYSAATFEQFMHDMDAREEESDERDEMEHKMPKMQDEPEYEDEDREMDHDLDIEDFRDDEDELDQEDMDDMEDREYDRHPKHEEEEDDFEREPESEDVAQIERMLKKFEEPEYEEDEDY